MKHELSGLSFCALQHVFKCKQSLFGLLKPGWWISPGSQKLYKDFLPSYVQSFAYHAWMMWHLFFVSQRQLQQKKTWNHHHTGNGNTPAPVDMVNIQFLSRFHTSQVVQDVFHQLFGASHRHQVELSCFTIIRYSSSCPFLTSPMDPKKIRVWTLFALLNM